MNRHTLHVIIGAFTVVALAVLGASCTTNPPDGAGADWAHYLGHPTSNQYSTLDQITTENVQQLAVAWTYETGDSAMYQGNNLVVEGVLYTATPTRKVTALNAATGAHRWTFDPDAVHEAEGRPGQQRGVMSWQDGDDRRILTTKGPWLYALDAETGQPVSSFGEGGWIHMGDGMDVEVRSTRSISIPARSSGRCRWASIPN